MQNKILKLIAALGCGCLLTVSYATCYTSSTQNCAYQGEVHSYVLHCSNTAGVTFTVGRDATCDNNVSVTDYEIVPTSPGNNYWTAITLKTCYAFWDYIDCDGQSRVTDYLNLTPYYSPSGSQTCTVP